MPEQTSISFTVIENGVESQIVTPVRSYRNLMVLLKDRFCFDYFGECGGQGRCATCLVKLEGNEDNALYERVGNEEATLVKNGISGNDQRLSCQVLINEKLQGVRVILEESNS